MDDTYGSRFNKQHLIALMNITTIISSLIVVLHFVVVSVVLYGWLGVFTKRFLRFHRKDTYVYVFYFCALGQLLSELTRGSCILTDIERSLRLSADPTVSYSTGFLQHYLPFLPTAFVNSLGICTLVALTIASVQVAVAMRSQRDIR